MDRKTDELDIMVARDVCRLFGIDERTLQRWVKDKFFPKATMYGRQRGWRRGQLQKWMEATELLQGLGLTTLVAPNETGDDETVPED